MTTARQEKPSVPTPDAAMYRVQIVESSTGKVVKTMRAVTKRMAEKIDSGANINLNHEQYHTRIVHESGETT